jgi:hypothetical protein
VGTTARHDIHKKRREALGTFFSKRNILYLEPVLSKKVEQLCQLIAKRAAEKTPINLSDAFYAFSNEYEFDISRGSIMLIDVSVVTNFLFAHQTNILANEAEAARLRRNSTELLKGININKHFPWLPDVLETLPLSISKSMMPPGLIDLLALFDVSPLLAY